MMLLARSHAQKVVASVRKAVDEVLALRSQDTTLDRPLPEPFSLLSQMSQSPAPQSVKISLPCFSSLLQVQALLPLYDAHELDDLGTELTVISALLTDP